MWLGVLTALLGTSLSWAVANVFIQRSAQKVGEVPATVLSLVWGLLLALGGAPWVEWESRAGLTALPSEAGRGGRGPALRGRWLTAPCFSPLQMPCSPWRFAHDPSSVVAALVAVALGGGARMALPGAFSSLQVQ